MISVSLNKCSKAFYFGNHIASPQKAIEITGDNSLPAQSGRSNACLMATHYVAAVILLHALPFSAPFSALLSPHFGLGECVANTALIDFN